MARIRRNTETATDGGASFDIDLYEPETRLCTVLFSPGRGGNPARHTNLLDALAESGCQVVAPHFDLLPSPIPTRDDLSLRVRRLAMAASAFAGGGGKLVGIGHSIGATTLLIAAGGNARTMAGESAQAETPLRFHRLLLFAPATDFFRAPDALHGVHADITCWAGTADPVTPPEQAEFLRAIMDCPLTVHHVDGAGHFTLMDELPPNIEDIYPDREAFLADFTREVCRAATG